MWYVNSEHHTMLILPSDAFFLAANGESVTLSLQVAIASTEVTCGQFRRFATETSLDGYAKDAASGGNEDEDSNALPQGGVSWYNAAAYCNWLSDEVGIDKSDWCYIPNERGEYAQGMRLAPDFQNRAGYRLPTAEEWECTSRGGTKTARFPANSDKVKGQVLEFLLRHYIHFGEEDLEATPKPVGGVFCNAYGFFDTLGNVSEWCNDSSVQLSDSEPQTRGSADVIMDEHFRVVKGGSIKDPLIDVTVELRVAHVPTTTDPFIGFRVARTLRSSGRDFDD